MDNRIVDGNTIYDMCVCIVGSKKTSDCRQSVEDDNCHKEDVGDQTYDLCLTSDYR